MADVDLDASAMGELPAGLASLEAALDRLAESDIGEISEGVSVIALYKARNRLDCLIAKASDRFASSGEWEASECRSALGWIAYNTHAPRGVVSSDLSNGRALRHLPKVEAAFQAGELTSDHVRVLAKARTEHTAEQMTADEGMLVDHARQFHHFGHFFRVLEYWSMFADPDAADKEHKGKVDRRRVELHKSIWGMYLGQMTLDPISGEIVHNELERLYKIMHAEEDHEVSTRPRRSPGQLRADALVEMARRSRSTPEGSRRPEPLFTVLVGWETLKGAICQTDLGAVLTRSALFPWLDCAWLERVVFDSASRVIDVGITQRLYTGATRRAVEVRDQECFHLTCVEPASECQVDHIQPFSAGGPTTTFNGRLACGFHNRARHDKRGPP